jgi:NAD(P)-dependent dehydrogenase (short-subunit alcohol dehydrogenase family)
MSSHGAYGTEAPRFWPALARGENVDSLGVIRTTAHDPISYTSLQVIHPLGRAGEISDVVDAILYLERATFVTGETLHVDRGKAAGR